MKNYYRFGSHYSVPRARLVVALLELRREGEVRASRSRFKLVEVNAESWTIAAEGPEFPQWASCFLNGLFIGAGDVAKRSSAYDIRVMTEALDAAASNEVES